MITKTTAFQASDGSFHASLVEAQITSLTTLFTDLEREPGQAKVIAERIMQNNAQVMDILTTTKRSRAQRRLVNGYPGHKRGNRSTQPNGSSKAAASGTGLSPVA
jgi:hypothetical protein